MSYNEKISPLREKIDFLDSEILSLLAKRFEVVNSVWELKKEYNIPPLDSSRWESLLKEKIEIWLALWMSEEFIVSLWNEIHKEALKKES